MGSNIDASLSKAYYLGGIKDPFSDPAFLSTGVNDGYAVEGLLTFDKSNQNFQNVSTVGMNNAGTMFFGFLTSISSIGSQGKSHTIITYAHHRVKIYLSRY